MIRFLRNLKTLVRATNCVCFLSVDEELLSKSLLNHTVYLSDLVLKINSFKDHVEMQIGEYDGVIKFLKVPSLHGLVNYIQDFDIYALRLKGKYNVQVEKIHLEPEHDRSG